MIDGLGLKAYFRVVLGGDSLPVKKPDGRVLEQLVERLGEAPKEIWMVGDGAVDVEMGRAAGARTIGCAWGLRGRDELRKAGVDALIEHPREITRVVFGQR